MPLHLRLLVSLVNLGTPGSFGGHPYEVPAEGDVTSGFTEHLGPEWSAALHADPDTGRRLIRLAEEFRGVFEASAMNDVAAKLNTLLAKYRPVPHLVEDSGHPFHLHFQTEATRSATALAGEYAVALALLVDEHGKKRFGVCEARRCDRVYVDLTRNGSRIYCGSACSARAKVAAYRDRRASQP